MSQLVKSARAAKTIGLRTTAVVQTHTKTGKAIPVSWKIDEALKHFGVRGKGELLVLKISERKAVMVRRILASKGLAQDLLEATPLQLKPSTEELRRQLTQRTVDAVLAGTRWLTPKELNNVRKPKTTNPSNTVKRWIDSGRMFAIERGNTRLIPAYGLDEMSEPVPMLQEVLRVMAGHTPFRIAAWFESPTKYLDGKRPRELLATAGMDVVKAAESGMLGAVHG